MAQDWGNAWFPGQCTCLDWFLADHSAMYHSLPEHIEVGQTDARTLARSDLSSKVARTFGCTLLVLGWFLLPWEQAASQTWRWRVLLPMLASLESIWGSERARNRCRWFWSAIDWLRTQFWAGLAAVSADVSAAGVSDGKSGEEPRLKPLRDVWWDQNHCQTSWRHYLCVQLGAAHLSRKWIQMMDCRRWCRTTHTVEQGNDYMINAWNCFMIGLGTATFLGKLRSGWFEARRSLDG